MKSVKKEVSFRRKLMTAVLSVTLPLIALLLFSNLYSTQAFNRKIADSNMRTMDYRAGRMEEQLDSVNDFLTGLTVSDDYRTLSGGEKTPLKAYLASYTLITQLKTALPAYGDVGAFFIYSVPSDAERDIFDDSISYAQKERLRAFVRDAVENNTYSYNMQWRHAEIGGKAYLFRFYGGRGTYLVAMVPLAALADARYMQIDTDAVMLFSDKNNEPLTSVDFVEGNGIDLNGDYENYFISGGKQRYMIVGRDLAGTDCRAILAVNESGYFGSLDGLQAALLVLSLLALVLIPVIQWRLTSSISKPVEGLRSVMEHIRAGDLGAKAEGKTNIREFNEVNETFNTMMTQIKDLKIESYEHEIETQKAELRYMQLQIRPHFFLNCLKSLYALAEAGKYDRIQKMILEISKHIRYIFTDSMELVPLSRELDHIENYIEMQRGSSQYPPVCRFDIDPRLRELPIPPLSLQSFVENCVKHVYSPDYVLEIEVKAAVLRSGADTFADLTVTDNGGGFPEDVIAEINEPDSPLYAQNHVGINNVKKRLQLIYGDRALYAFFNQDMGERMGSVSEILIPIDCAMLHAAEDEPDGEEAFNG